MNNKLHANLCIFAAFLHSGLHCYLSVKLISSTYEIKNDYMEKGCWMKSKKMALWRPGKLQHRAEGDASRSFSQGGGGVAQVNTLKSSSWDRWGVSHAPLPIPSVSPSAHTINGQIRQTDVTVTRRHFFCSNRQTTTSPLNGCELDKRQTWGRKLSAHVGSVNLFQHEPDRIMTENYWVVSFHGNGLSSSHSSSVGGNSYSALTVCEQ